MKKKPKVGDVVKVSEYPGGRAVYAEVTEVNGIYFRGVITDAKGVKWCPGDEAIFLCARISSIK